MADDPVKEEKPQEPEQAPELTPDQQAEQDALLSVNGDIHGEVRPNYSVDEVEPEPAEEAEPEETPESGQEGEEQAPETEVAPEIAPEADETGVYSEPSTNNPGDFHPGDYSFDVKLSNGNSVRISTPDEAQRLADRLDQDASLISASQFMVLTSKTALMERGIADDRKAYDDQKAKYEAEQSQYQTRENYLNQWNAEVNYLREKGALPPISPELNSADWSDPKVASQPGVKETLEVLKWMESENNSRMAAGLPPDMSVVSAHRAMQYELREHAERQSEASEKEVNRKRGAMVKGRSSSPAMEAPKSNAIVGSAKSLDDLMTEAYYEA